MESLTNLFDRLPAIHRLRWSLRLAEPFDAPRYLGSALRGLLGHGLRRTACVTRLKSCPGCPLADACVYTELFEPASRANGQGRAPYVLSVPITSGRHYSEGEEFVFKMTLFSPHHLYLPFLIQAFHAGGQLGLGPGKIRFEVAEVEALAAFGGADWQPVYGEGEMLEVSTAAAFHPPAPPEAAHLTWQTPWRLKRKGRFVGPKQFSPEFLLESLLYRSYEFLDERPPRPLLAQARNAVLHVEAQLDWQDWSRYSSRQKTRMQVGGLMGSIHLAGDDLPYWWPLLWLGQWLHLGKFTSMGLGRYRLSAASLRNAL